ncbi:MAG: phosphate ABC transporter permease subunit PstC [Roseococcus sp.]|nr:phosphate ABC transporter permease subunit PstC [Roseococcus sp.]
MALVLLLSAILLLAAFGHWSGARFARRARAAGLRLPALPAYYGWYVALWTGLPSLLLLVLWAATQDWAVRQVLIAHLPEGLAALPADRLSLELTTIRNIAYGLMPRQGVSPEVLAAAAEYLRLRELARLAGWGLALSAAVGGLAFAAAQLSPRLRARHAVERLVLLVLLLCSVVAILTTVGIVLSLISESLRFFARVPAGEFFLGLTWSPQTAIRAEQVGASGAFGAVPLFAGTLLIGAVAMLTCVPLGLMAAVWMSEYAPARVRDVAKPALEVLAGIPSVVYGFFAMLTVAPVVRELGTALGFEVAAQSALAAGVVMGVMIIPNVSSLSDDVIRAVPMSLREGSLSLGATRAETVTRVVLPAALPGIVAAVILAFSRALGETMIVVMAAGLAANITVNPLDAVTTVTVHIAMLLVGDQEFDSAKTLSAFALGLVLFFATLTLNLIALHLARRYRERYD